MLAYGILAAGALLQIAYLLHGENYWMLYIGGFIAMAGAAFLGLKSMGYNPLRSRDLYRMLFVLLVLPVIGPVAAFHKLATMPRFGEKLERKASLKASLVAVGLFLIIVAIYFLIAYPSFDSYHKRSHAIKLSASIQTKIDNARASRKEGRNISQDLISIAVDIEQLKDIAKRHYSSGTDWAELYACDVLALKELTDKARRCYQVMGNRLPEPVKIRIEMLGPEQAR